MDSNLGYENKEIKKVLVVTIAESGILFSSKDLIDTIPSYILPSLDVQLD